MLVLTSDHVVKPKHTVEIVVQISFVLPISALALRSFPEVKIAIILWFEEKNVYAAGTASSECDDGTTDKFQTRSSLVGSPSSILARVKRVDLSLHLCGDEWLVR